MTACAGLATRFAIPAGAYSAGTWSGVVGFQALAYDLDSVVTVPPGSKTVILALNTNSTGARGGAQKAGATDLLVSDSVVNDRQDYMVPVELGVGNTIDVFLTNTINGAWYVVAFTDHFNHITPVSVGGAITAASTYTIDLGATDIVPSDAAGGCVIVSVDKIAQLAGKASDLLLILKPSANVLRSYVIVPIDAARKFYVKSYASFSGASALQVVAWAKPGCFVPGTYTTEDVSTADNTFRKLSLVSNGSLNFYTVSAGNTTTGGSGSLLAGLRPSGDTSYTVAIDGDTKTNNSYRYVLTSATYEVDALATVSGVHNQYMGTLVADTTAPAIVSSTPFNAGATSTLTLDKNGTPSNLAIKSVFDSHVVNVTSFTATADPKVWTYTVPDVVNNADGIRLGPVIMNVTTAPGLSADFTSNSYAKVGYSFVNMEDVLPGNVCEGDTPALLTQDQLIRDPSKMYIDVHGWGFSPDNDPDASYPPYYGIVNIGHYSKADFKWYLFDADTTIEVITSTTAKKITATKITATKLLATKITAKKS